MRLALLEISVTMALTGGFVAGVLASFLAGVLVVLLERRGHFDSVHRNERRQRRHDEWQRRQHRDAP